MHRGRVHWARALETPTFLPVQSPARTPIRSAGYWRGARMSACGARRVPVTPPLPSAVPSRPIGHFRLSSLPCPSPSTPLAPFRPSIPSASALVVAVNPLHFFPRRARPSSEARAIPTRPHAPVRPVLRSPPHARVRRSQTHTFCLAHCSSTAVPSRVSIQAAVGRRPRSACLTIPEDEEEGVVAEGGIGAESIGLER